MSDIPLYIYREILLRLPAESLFRFRAVCKRWCAVIDDPCFVRAHTNNQLSSNSTNIIIRISAGPPFYPLYLFDIENLNFANGLQTIPVTPLNFTRRGLSRLRALPVASCNGLMLTAFMHIKRKAHEAWEIRNPLTHERLKLPQPNIINSKGLGYGLGYDCASDDYKAVAMELGNPEYSRHTHVYSLKSDSWKKIRECPFKFDSPNMRQRGVFLNGSLHWLLGDGIIALDVATENYRQLALPPTINGPGSSTRLDVLSGCLFLSNNVRWDVSQLDVWVMNDYDGGKDSWTKLFSIDRDIGGPRPVAYMKNKNRVLLQYYDEFILFDVESNLLKSVSIHGVSELWAQVCVGTLFRLRDSCGRVIASKGKKRTREMKMSGHTKLTLCVRGDLCTPWSHGDCCKFDSNWFNSSSEGSQVRASPFSSDAA